MKKYILLLLLIPGLLAADPLELSLDDVIAIGLKNSTTLKISHLDLENQKQIADSMYNIFYPKLSASLGLTRRNEDSSKTIMVPDPSSALTEEIFDRVYVSEIELSPYTLLANLKAELAFSPVMFDSISKVKLDYQAGLITRQETEKKLIRDIKKSFYQILVLEDNLKLYEELTSTLKERYQQTASDYNNGFVSELTLLNVKIAYETMGPRLGKLKSAIDHSLMLFKLAIGIDINTHIILSGEIDVPEVNFDFIKNQHSFSNRFDMLKLENSIEQIKTAMDMAFHAAYFPVVAISYSFNPILPDPFNSESWEPEPFDNWSDQGSLNLVLTWPLENFLPFSQKSNEIKAMDTKLEILKIQKHALYENAVAESQMLLNSLEDSFNQLEALNLNVIAAQRNLKLTEEAYRAGIVDFVALQVAEDNLQETRQNVLAEKADLLNILFDMEYALNIDFNTIQGKTTGE